MKPSGGRSHTDRTETFAGRMKLFSWREKQHALRIMRDIIFNYCISLKHSTPFSDFYLLLHEIKSLENFQISLTGGGKKGKKKLFFLSHSECMTHRRLGLF